MEVLRLAMKKLGIDHVEERLDIFYRYRNLVLEWNMKVNLTAIKDHEGFETKHFVDSLMAATFEGFHKESKLIDLGTGAGFPGLPLAICFPSKDFILVDSLNKRVKILNEIIADLGVKNAIALHGRAEDLARDKAHREKYGICLSRAVADLAILSEYCLPFVRVGGYFAAYKGQDMEGELESSKKAVKALGGRYKTTTEGVYGCDDLNHQIVWLEKVGTTPGRFPRKAGIPSKDPIK